MKVCNLFKKFQTEYGLDLLEVVPLYFGSCSDRKNALKGGNWEKIGSKKVKIDFWKLKMDFERKKKGVFCTKQAVFSTIYPKISTKTISCKGSK